MITVESPIIGKGGSTQEALDYLGVTNSIVQEYVAELWRLCNLVGFDFRILFAQAAHETDNFNSKWWIERRNPAGIGITGDPAQNEASHAWANGIEAARAQVVHMWAYANDVVLMSQSQNHAALQYTKLDPRFDAVIDAGFLCSVHKLGDLGNGKWATDPKYAPQIAAKANAIFKGATPMPNQPLIYDLATDYAHFGITKANADEVLSHRFENRGQGSVNVGKPTFIVCHIQAGFTKGSLEYWNHDGGASSTVMIQRDGSILRVIPEQHGPWTNGDDNQPTAAGRRLVDLPGNSNLYTLSIEAEGLTGDAVEGVQLDAIEWQVREWMTRYGIPLANVIRHADINQVNKPNCPGAYYPKLIARLSATPIPEPTPPTYATPAPISWEEGDVGIHDLNGTPANAFKIQVRVVVAKVIPQVSETDTTQAGPMRKKNTLLTAIGVYRDKQRRPFVVLRDKTRVPYKSVRPLVPLPPVVA